MKTLSEKLQNSQKPRDIAPHLIVEALAGTGKTTTLIEGLKVLKGLKNKPVPPKGYGFEDYQQFTDLVPSEQQAAIWNAMCMSEGARTVCFVAFNKSIAIELQKRVPDGCDAMTMHSMGFRAIRTEIWVEDLKVNQHRVSDIIAEILGRDIHDIRLRDMDLLKATERLVGLCKMNLVGADNENTPLTDSIISRESLIQEFLPDLAAHYDIDLNGQQSRVFDLVPKVLERCKDVGQDGCIDFNDMIWLPVVLDLPVTRYDLLLVDECQDLNRCQQQLALRAGHRLILVGDSRQAIYGFAGADGESMKRMHSLLGGNVGCPDSGKIGCQVLPLTVTRRCGRAIVKEAQKIVPNFEAHETCCDGKICHALFEDKGEDKVDLLQNSSYRHYAGPCDMILCRTNAPLVSECFKFLKDGRKANIQGRDVGQGLISTIKKMKAIDVAGLSASLSVWLHAETRKENHKRNPSEARLIALNDRYDCLACFCWGQETVANVIKRIEDVFTDDKQDDGIKLSSIHKAKGLEADRVFILQPKSAPMPHPMAKSKWQIKQEWNCLYIAITRAKKELIYVS